MRKPTIKSLQIEIMHLRTSVLSAREQGRQEGKLQGARELGESREMQKLQALERLILSSSRAFDAQAQMMTKISNMIEPRQI